jgi:glycosyltransferase involved in cell wall biosynthesis
MTRVAIVRGPFLNPYELAPYRALQPEFELFAVAARRCFTESDATGLEVRRLRCPETEISVRRGKLLNMAPWFLGLGYSMLGLRHAVADADVIHTAETYFGFSLQSAHAASKLGRALVVTVKETIPDVEKVHPLRRHGREASVKAEVDAATTLYLPISGAAATSLEMEGVDPKRMRVVPPAVDVERFRPGARPPGEPTEILFVGPALWRKGILEAIRALALVRRQLPARLTILGGGADLVRALDLAHELGLGASVRHLARVPYAEMPALYQGADVLLAPSIPTRTWQEQDSMAVLEAMASGLPVVATPGGIRRELLADEGFWCAPGDYIDAADRLLEVIGAPAEAARRGAILRARAEQKHALGVVSAKLADAYRQVAG